MSFFRAEPSAAGIRERAAAAQAESAFVLRLRERQSMEVRNAQARLRTSSVDRELGQMSVDTLLDAGGSKRTVSALKSAGYGTVRDVAARNAFELSAVRGIGDTGAQSAHSAAQQIKASLLRDYRLRFERQHRNAETDSLLQALHTYRRAASIQGAVIETARSVHRVLGKGLDATELVDHPWRYLFSGMSVKAGLHEDLEILRQYVASSPPSETAAFAGTWRRSSTGAPVGQLWEELEQDQSGFYSSLAAANGSAGAAAADMGNLGSELGGETSGGLTDLVTRINSSALDGGGSLRVVLRPYQVFGAKFALEQKRTILGDEMGLGKTIEAIAVMCHLAARGETHFAVAAPLSLVHQWVREIAQKSDLKIHRPHGARLIEGLIEWARCGGVAVFSIDTLKSVPPSLVNNAEVGLFVIDEAQMVKNPRTMRSIGVQRWIESAERTLMLTGSPLENRVEEFFALESLLRPSGESLLSESARYSPARFRTAVAPVYLRRTQADVLRELPPIINVDEWVSLTERETLLYREAGWSRNFHTLRTSTFSKEVAEPTKMSRIVQIVADAQANGKKVVIFSYYRDVLKRVAEELQGSPIFGPLEGSVPTDRRDLLVTDFVDAPGHAVLVAQIVTGGQGLNLQCASVAILCEPQLKPSSESQAIARLQRMGQRERVQVHRLIAVNTVDESLLGMLERKKKIFDEYAGRSDLADEVKRVLEMGETQIANAIVESEFQRASGVSV